MAARVHARMTCIAWTKPCLICMAQNVPLSAKSFAVPAASQHSSCIPWLIQRTPRILGLPVGGQRTSKSGVAAFLMRSHLVEAGRDMRQRLSALSGFELRYAISDSWIPDRHFRFENEFRRRFNKDMFKFPEHPMLLGKKRRIFTNIWASTSEEKISTSDDDIASGLQRLFWKSPPALSGAARRALARVVPAPRTAGATVIRATWM